MIERGPLFGGWRTIRILCDVCGLGYRCQPGWKFRNEDRPEPTEHYCPDCWKLRGYDKESHA
jgi:hypothetical protein